MADTKFSAGTPVTTPGGGDIFALDQGGVSKTDTRDGMATYCAAPYFCVLSADYTLTSTTSAQKAFNTTTNGAVTLPVGLYMFEWDVDITTMSATSGNAVFSFAGTAVLANPRSVSAYGLDATTLATGAAVGGSFVSGGISATTNITTAATGTGLGASIRGIFAVTTTGTVIPSIALTTAAAAVMKAGSIIVFRRIGAATDTSRGPWT